MDFKKLTRQAVDRKYIQMLDGSTPPPYESDVEEIDESHTYSSKRDRYYTRLSQEKNEFNKAIKRVCDTRDARLKNEADDAEARAHVRYKIFKALKTIAFLLPIALSVFTGIELFSNRRLYNVQTGAPFIFFWVVFALGTLVGSIFLLKSLYQNETYYNKNRIDGAVKHSVLSIFITIVVLVIGVSFVSLTSSVVLKKGDFVFTYCSGEYYLTKYAGNDEKISLPNDYEGKSYRIAEKAFKGNNDITYALIPNTIKYIGNSAFENCESLSVIIIGEGVVELGDRTFKGCTSLKQI
ncbi:MAG: leucine-rich repeat protein, partial [Clostridia bacterium]|nr:leucine-rich repeat protein [Clostridia bacterium]